MSENVTKRLKPFAGNFRKGSKLVQPADVINDKLVGGEIAFTKAEWEAVKDKGQDKLFCDLNAKPGDFSKVIEQIDITKRNIDGAMIVIDATESQADLALFLRQEQAGKSREKIVKALKKRLEGFVDVDKKAKEINKARKVKSKQ